MCLHRIITQTHQNPEQRVKSLLSILYFRWKSRGRKHSLAWFHLILPKNKTMVWSHPCSLTPPGNKLWPHFWTSRAKTPGNLSQTAGAARKKTMMYLTQQVRKQARLSHVSPPLQENACVKVILRCNTWISLCSSSSPGPPIVSEEELTCLALISPANTSQYSGSRVRALIQILQHQMDQQELVKEFMVCECVCVCADVYSMYVWNYPGTYQVIIAI